VTGTAAGVFRIPDRGVLRAGAFADLVLLDAGHVREGNSYLEPTRPPVGIERVYVNGKLVYAGQKHTGARSGRVLRRA
jgi:N-acyl-D-amino-acid deacylase